MTHVPMCLWCGEREVVGMYSLPSGEGYCSGLCEEEALTELEFAREEFTDADEPEFEEGYEPREDQFRDDVEADADVLRSVGWGTDEDYGYYGDGDY